MNRGRPENVHSPIVLLVLALVLEESGGVLE
jgi:hypothetical protein